MPTAKNSKPAKKPTIAKKSKTTKNPNTDKKSKISKTGKKSKINKKSKIPKTAKQVLSSRASDKVKMYRYNAKSNENALLSKVGISSISGFHRQLKYIQGQQNRKVKK